MPNLLELRNELLEKARSNGHEPLLYDLGCGQVPEPGFKGIDYHSKTEGVESIDLYQFPWPIKAGTVDYFRASHFVEHIPDWDSHFAEVYSALRDGGYYEIISPYYLNNRWFQDPDHKQPILQERFLYLSNKWKKINKIDHYGARVNFEMIGWFELLHEDYRDQGYSDYDLVWHKKHSWNVVDDVALVLKKLPMEE